MKTLADRDNWDFKPDDINVWDIFLYALVPINLSATSFLLKYSARYIIISSPRSIDLIFFSFNMPSYTFVAPSFPSIFIGVIPNFIEIFFKRISNIIKIPFLPLECLNIGKNVFIFLNILVVSNIPFTFAPALAYCRAVYGSNGLDPKNTVFLPIRQF